MAALDLHTATRGFSQNWQRRIHMRTPKELWLLWVLRYHFYFTSSMVMVCKDSPWIALFIQLCTHPRPHPSIDPPIHTCTHPSIQPCTHPYINSSIQLSIMHPTPIHPTSIDPCIHPLTHPSSVHPSISFKILPKYLLSLNSINLVSKAQKRKSKCKVVYFFPRKVTMLSMNL